jgi:hypothetical protein
VQDTSVTPPQHPLRFTWHMDEHNRFSLGDDAFTRLIGNRSASAFGRPWQEIATILGLDPQGRVADAVATRELEQYRCKLACRRRRRTASGRTVRSTGL